MLPSVPGPPEHVHNLCTVVIWDTPENPNEEITSYILSFSVEGTNKTMEKTVLLNSSDTRYFIAEGDIPEGEGKVFVKVRNDSYRDYKKLKYSRL